MDYLKDGIGLRAMAQRDPLIEYQREGYDMFNTMLDGLKEECIMLLFRAQVAEPEEAPPPGPGGDAARVQQAAARAAQATQRQAPPQQQMPPPPPQQQIPPALRGNLPPEQQFTYSGPSEGGGVQSRGGRNGNGQKPGGQQGQGQGQGQGGSRRDRRAAARDAQRKGKKGPRR
jgi:preprotein translocase subunit SecA